MQQRYCLLTIASLLCLTAGLTAQVDDDHAATAAAGEATPVSDFESADRDANGKISVEEFRNRMTKVFFELDANKDGILQEDEFSAVLIAPHYELADTDADAAISHREFMGHIIYLFETVDTDGDGHFTRDELQAAGHEEEDR